MRQRGTQPLRPFATPAGGLQTNTMARTPALAGLAPGAAAWHPRFLQFPNRHMLDGCPECGVGADTGTPTGGLMALALGGIALYAVLAIFIGTPETPRTPRRYKKVRKASKHA